MTKILLVEDNELNRDMLSRRLRRRGYEVVLAMDGAEAVAIAPTQPFDLILMDMSLPVMDGWEATRQIKANPPTQNLPIIALTAHAMVGDRERAIAAGCDDYDTKPIDLKRLLSKVSTFLPAGSSTPEPATSTPVTHTKSTTAQATSPSSSSMDNPEGVRILVVDDNADNRDLLTRRLQRRGYRAPHADSGEVALQLLQQQTDIVLVLLDIMMPGMDGIETLQQIRKRFSRSQLPVVMVTAKSQSDDMVQAFEQGANDYITKPIDFEVALARIESHLATSQRVRELAYPPLNTSAPSTEASTVKSQPNLVAHTINSIQTAALEQTGDAEQAPIKATPAPQLSPSGPGAESSFGVEAAHLEQMPGALAERYQIQSTLSLEPLGPVAIAQVLPTQELTLLQTVEIPSSDLYPMLSAALAEEFAQLGPLQALFPNLSTGQVGQTLYIAHNLTANGHPENLLQAELESHQPWSLDAVLALMNDLLQLLEPFHQRNQVHGGINARSFIRRDGNLQLMDSGLGKRVLMRVSQQSAEYRKRLLMQRNYLPMEQRIGRPVLSSDLYALGLIGLQALTGLSLGELKLSSAPISSSTWQQQVDISAPLMEWFENLISSNPTERYPQVMAARAALQSLPLESRVSPLLSY